MVHLLRLGLQIEPVVLVGFHLDRYGFYHFETIALYASKLARIVGYKAHLRDTYMSENLRANAIVAFIVLEAEMPRCKFASTVS